MKLENRGNVVPDLKDLYEELLNIRSRYLWIAKKTMRILGIEGEVLINDIKLLLQQYNVELKYERKIEYIEGAHAPYVIKRPYSYPEIGSKIEILYNKNFIEELKIDYTKSIKDIIILLQHEWTHKIQLEKRKTFILKNLELYSKSLPEEDIIEYLSNKDEITAYANTIILKLKLEGYSKNKITKFIQYPYNYLNFFKKTGNPMIFYLEKFNKSDKPIKRLFSQMYKILNYLEENYEWNSIII